MASKRSRDRLLMVGAAAVSAVAFYFAWKAFRSAAAHDDKDEDGEKELQDLEELMKTKEEKRADAAGVISYSEEQDGFTVEEFEHFVAEEYRKPQAEVTAYTPSNLIAEQKFAAEDFIRAEEEQHGESRGKFEDSGIPCDGFLESAHLCLTSPLDEIENELQEDNHSVNLIRSGPCIGHDVCDSGLTETIYGIANGISDNSNLLFGDFEGFSSSNPGTLLGQAEFHNSSNSHGIQGIGSEDFVIDLCSSRDVGYDEMSRQKVVMFLGNGAQACDLKNQPDGHNASEFHQTSIHDKGISCEGPLIELSDDGQHHNYKVADSEEPLDVGIALEHEFDSSVNKGLESLGSQEGLDAESSNSSDEGCNEHPSDNDSESSTVESSEHADRETTTVCSEKPLDGQIIPMLEPDSLTNNEKMEGPSPVTELCSSRDVGYEESSRQTVVVFLGNGVHACDLKNQPGGQNASEFHQTSISDNGISCEGPVIELSDVTDESELSGHLSDDGQHHNHKVADSEEPSDLGIALEQEFDSCVNKGMESLGPQEGLDAESSSSSDEGCNEHPSDNDSESSTVESSEHEDRGATTVYSEKPLDGQIIPLLELGNMTNNEKMEGPSPVTKASSSVNNVCDELFEEAFIG